jgi:tetratricopeptide (TPR) repeat protein
MATKKKKASDADAKKAAPARGAGADAYDAAVAEFASAMELLQKGEYAEARSRLEEVEKAVPEEAHLTDRVRTYVKVCNRKLADSPSAPETVEDLFYLGVLQTNEGLLDEAVDTLTRALEQQPDSVRVLYARSAARALQRRTDDAVADLRKAVGLEPTVRFQAVNDSDFDGIRDEAAFIDIVEPTPSEV